MFRVLLEVCAGNLGLAKYTVNNYKPISKFKSDKKFEPSLLKSTLSTN